MCKVQEHISCANKYVVKILSYNSIITLSLQSIVSSKLEMSAQILHNQYILINKKEKERRRLLVIVIL
jgi:hypothetical protein